MQQIFLKQHTTSKPLASIILFLVIIFIVSLILTGCGDTNTVKSSIAATPTSSTAPMRSREFDAKQIKNKVTLDFWQGLGNVDNIYLLARKVAKFNATYPNIEVKLTNYGAPDKLKNRLDLALLSKQGPDLLWWGPQEFGLYADKGFLLPAQEFINQDRDFVKEDIYQGLWDSSTYKGQIWTVPFDANCLAIYYNKKMFEKAGIRQLPTTWEEFSAVAQKLTDKTTDTAGFLVPFGADEWVVWTYQTALWQAGGSILDSTQTKATFNSPAGVKALKWWKSMLENGSAILSEPEKGQQLNWFFEGKVAMMINGPWNYPDLEKEKSLEYGAFPLPKDITATTNIGGESLYMFKNSNPDKELAEWIFAKYILSPEFQVEWAINSGYLPVSRSAASSPEYKEFLDQNEFIRLYQQQLAIGRSRPTTPAYNAVSAAMGQAILEYLSDKEFDPQKALDKAAREANLELAKVASPPGK